MRNFLSTLRAILIILFVISLICTLLILAYSFIEAVIIAVIHLVLNIKYSLLWKTALCGLLSLLGIVFLHIKELKDEPNDIINQSKNK